VSAPVDRRNCVEFGRADDVDTTVRPVFQPKDFVTANEAVLYDPIEISAPQLVSAARPHSRCHAKLSTGCARGNARGQGFTVAAPERNLCQMEIRH